MGSHGSKHSEVRRVSAARLTTQFNPADARERARLISIIGLFLGIYPMTRIFEIRNRALYRTSLVIVALTLTNSWSSTARAEAIPFQLRVIEQTKWKPSSSPPPGITWIGNIVIVVAPMVLGDPCREPIVEVRSTSGTSPKTTSITVELLGSRSRLPEGSACMAVLWPVYVVVTIPNLAPGGYAINVRDSIYRASIELPNPGGHLSPKGEVRPWREPQLRN